ncbi:TIGR00730 family Rossman fold protein [Candidatus Babeliales bacterium]|nr:TIGR00730 family Rossman fold protein [Candidatus Babeliales bacterium]
MISFFRRIKEFFSFFRSMVSVNVNLLVGMWKLTKLHKPSVTIFGGARIDLESDYAKHATELARMLAEKGFSIVTGGGPGIMEAANFGVYKYKEECEEDGSCKLPVSSFGIGLTRLNRERKNPYVQESIILEHFFERKWLLVRSAIGFAVFPGGFGTLDELFEIVVLMQTGRMQRAPIVLFGKSYWQPILNWVHDKALKTNMLAHEDAALISVTDDVKEAFSIITHMAFERMGEK